MSAGFPTDTKIENIFQYILVNYMQIIWTPLLHIMVFIRRCSYTILYHPIPHLPHVGRLTRCFPMGHIRHKIGLPDTFPASSRTSGKHQPAHITGRQCPPEPSRFARQACACRKTSQPQSALLTAPFRGTRPAPSAPAGVSAASTSLRKSC